MVQINNQAVIQKLIDELKLYPGTGIIPTELAEKVLPCFIINSQEINMSPTSANVVRYALDSGGGGANVYTVPASPNKFYLTNVILTTSTTSDPSGSRTAKVEVTIDGTTQQLLTTRQEAAAIVSGGPVVMSLNLQNPILLDPESIVVVSGHAEIKAGCNIVGYTE